MDLALNILHDGGLHAATDWWRVADESGISAIAIPDSPALLPELYVYTAACAERTSQARVITGVTNPVSRDPSVTAAALYALNEIAPGRIVLGIGTGDSALWSVGRSPARIAQLREYILAVRAMLAGEKATYQGRSIQTRWRLDSDLAIPILVAAAGPKVLRLAAQIADGAIVSMGYASENIAQVLEIVAEACAEVGRDPDDFDIWWNSEVVFGDSVEQAKERSLGVTVAWLTMGTMKGKLIPERHQRALIEFTADVHDLDATYVDGDRERELVERAKTLGLYDWLVERAPGFWGTPADIAARLRTYESAGMSKWMFYVGRGGGDRGEHTRLICKELMPLL